MVDACTGQRWVEERGSRARRTAGRARTGHFGVRADRAMIYIFYDAVSTLASRASGDGVNLAVVLAFGLANLGLSRRRALLRLPARKAVLVFADPSPWKPTARYPVGLTRVPTRTGPSRCRNASAAITTTPSRHRRRPGGAVAVGSVLSASARAGA